MEEKPNSSFIPKKPLTKTRRSGASDPTSSFFYKISIAVFFLSLLVSAGVYGYSVYLGHQIQNMEGELEEAASALESTDLDTYKLLDQRIQRAEEITNDHRVSSTVFDRLSEVTLQSVRFTNFELAFETSAEDDSLEAFLDEGSEEDPQETPVASSRRNGVVTVALEGEAGTFDTAALQAEEFRASDFFENAQFSELGVSQENGLVTFAVSAEIDPEQINYLAVLEQLEQAEQVAPAGSTGTTAPQQGASTSTGASESSTPPQSSTGSPATTTTQGNSEEIGTEIVTSLSQARSQAESIYNANGTYSGICESSEVTSAFALAPSLESNCTVSAGGEQWIAWSELPAQSVGAGAFCVDSTGYADLRTVPSNGIALCNAN